MVGGKQEKTRQMVGGKFKDSLEYVGAIKDIVQ
jgi:hypothetical protein